jgi:hypothetical protein
MFFKTAVKAMYFISEPNKCMYEKVLPLFHGIGVSYGYR